MWHLHKSELFFNTVSYNTINILKVEMSKESPDTWKRVKKALLEQADGEEFDMSILRGDA